MANITFGYENKIDDGDIIASSELSTLPAINMQDPRVDTVWRSDSVTDGNIVFDLGSAQAIQMFVLKNHNFSSSITVLKLQANATNSWGSPSIDWDLLNRSGYNTYQAGIIIWLFSAETYRYWRLVYIDDSNPDGYAQISRPFLCPIFSPAYDKEANSNFSLGDRSEIIESMDGTLYSNVKDKQYDISFNLDFVFSNPAGVDDLQSFINMFNDVGINKDFILSFNPDKSPGETTNRYSNLKRFSWYGRLINKLQIQHSAGKRYSLPMVFRESI